MLKSQPLCIFWSERSLSGKFRARNDGLVIYSKISQKYRKKRQTKVIKYSLRKEEFLIANVLSGVNSESLNNFLYFRCINNNPIRSNIQIVPLKSIAINCGHMVDNIYPRAVNVNTRY